MASRKNEVRNNFYEIGIFIFWRASDTNSDLPIVFAARTSKRLLAEYAFYIDGVSIILWS